MSDPLSRPTNTLLHADRSDSSTAPFEPVGALVVGSIAGALAFVLSTLLLGTLTGILLAISCAAIALERRSILAAALFALAGGQCALAFFFPASGAMISVWAGGVFFGVALAIAVRTRRVPPASS